jgi:hypothetical protein
MMCGGETQLMMTMRLALAQQPFGVAMLAFFDSRSSLWLLACGACHLVEARYRRLS